jgi:hypothetical protein
LALREGERVRLLVVHHSDPARWISTAGAAEDEALAEAGLGAWADGLDALEAWRDLEAAPPRPRKVDECQPQGT